MSCVMCNNRKKKKKLTSLDNCKAHLHMTATCDATVGCMFVGRAF